MIKSPPLRIFVTLGLLGLCLVFVVCPYWLLTETPSQKFAMYLTIMTAVAFMFGGIAIGMYKSNRDTSISNMGKIELAEHIAQAAQAWMNEYGNEGSPPSLPSKVVAYRIKARSEAKIIEASNE